MKYVKNFFVLVLSALCIILLVTGGMILFFKYLDFILDITEITVTKCPMMYILLGYLPLIVIFIIAALIYTIYLYKRDKNNTKAKEDNKVILENSSTDDITDSERENTSKAQDVAINIISIFEHLLDKYDIDIPDENRSGEESEARIYGESYYDLEKNILDELEKSKLIDPRFFEKDQK